MLAIGLMSGTSMDAVDAALIDTDGENFVAPVDFLALPYGEADRARLREAMARARAMARPGDDPIIVRAAEVITARHIEAVRALIAQSGVTPEIIGFHGQTIAHQPNLRWTWQIGDGAQMARTLGVTVIDDFRSADVAAGGEGAPLAPVYHRALIDMLGERPVAVLNLGGVANITWFGSDADSWGAFDTGPANALIDDWVREHAGLSHDAGGTIAARGEIDQAALDALMANDWFTLPPPKSLDRNHFSVGALSGLSLEDGAATLAAFTADSLGRAFDHLPERPERVLAAGGGRHNPTLMAMIAGRLGIAVDPVETVGWNGDALEAELFGYLAVRTLKGLPCSFPSTTGVKFPVTGGTVNKV